MHPNAALQFAGMMLSTLHFTFSPLSPPTRFPTPSQCLTNGWEVMAYLFFLCPRRPRPPFCAKLLLLPSADSPPPPPPPSSPMLPFFFALFLLPPDFERGELSPRDLIKKGNVHQDFSGCGLLMASSQTDELHWGASLPF